MPPAMQRTLVALVALAALALPASTHARSLSTSPPSILSFAAGPGRADVVTVTDVGSAWSVQLPWGTAPSVCGPWLGSFWCGKTGVARIAIATLDGNDRVTLTAAVPVDVSAGDGDDRIDARNGVADVIDCGAGDDRAEAEAADTLSNCEADVVPLVSGVTAPVADEQPVEEPRAKEPKESREHKDEASPAVAGSLPLIAAVAVLAGPIVRVGGDGSAPLTVGCGTDQVAGCAGTVLLDPLKKARGKRKSKARAGSFGSSAFAAAPGQTVDVGVPLTATARKALGLPSPGKARAARRGRRVKAVVTVVPKGKGKAKQRAVVELRT
jgi:hypothetical protein